MALTRSSGLSALRPLLLLWVSAALSVQSAISVSRPDALPKRQAASATALVDFQVYEPVLTPTGAAGECSQLLMEHVFAFSYGRPFVGIIGLEILRTGRMADSGKANTLLQLALSTG